MPGVCRWLDQTFRQQLYLALTAPSPVVPLCCVLKGNTLDFQCKILVSKELTIVARLFEQFYLRAIYKQVLNFSSFSFSN